MKARVLAVLGVGLWCFFVLFAALAMIVDRGLGDVGIAWVGLLGIGVAAPVLLLWQVNRAIATHEASRQPVPDDRQKEKELLGAFENRGELTPVTAAISTSLTADEASAMLDKMVRKGYLERRKDEGVVSYALGERNGLGPPQETAALPEAAADAGGAPLQLEDPLSERELEVLTLLASGRTNSEVARDLFVSVGTVKSHTGNIYRKLGARNRAEALARARELGILA